MKNLEKYSVLEMDSKEMKEVDGGFLWGLFVNIVLLAFFGTLLKG